MLDLKKVREAYFHPPADDPERIPTREERYALYERRHVRACLRRGGDPRREGLGEHGSLIGGRGKPLTMLSIPPERARRLQPLLPLAWFDYPRARDARIPRGGIREILDLFLGLAAAHLAGHPDRPGGGRLASMFRSVRLDERGQSLVWHVFACIRICDLKRLLSRGGMSVYEVARAAHLCGTIRPRVIVWINQFAVPPAEQEGLDFPDEPARPSVAGRVPRIRGSLP